MYKEAKNFEDLVCWQKARELKKKLYKLSKKLPDYETYKLGNQIRSAAVSVTANIAEGFGRFNYQEKIHFARISRGSLFESQDHLYTCLDEKYISQEEFDELYNECVNVAKSLNGYISFILRQKK